MWNTIGDKQTNTVSFTIELKRPISPFEMRFVPLYMLLFHRGCTYIYLMVSALLTNNLSTKWPPRDETSYTVEYVPI